MQQQLAETIEKIELVPHPDGTIVKVHTVADDQQERWSSEARNQAVSEVLTKALDALNVEGSDATPRPLPVPVLVGERASVPVQKNEGDAGADLCARESVRLGPGGRAIVSTGLHMAIPAGHVGLIHSRSGLAAQKGVIVLNAPGVIDSGYRGDIGVILHNTSQHAVNIAEGERIAQMIFQRYENPDFLPVSTLSESARGQGGFGSTGTI